jgi:hypothetical protein
LDPIRCSALSRWLRLPPGRGRADVKLVTSFVQLTSSALPSHQSSNVSFNPPYHALPAPSGAISSWNWHNPLSIGAGKIKIHTTILPLSTPGQQDVCYNSSMGGLELERNKHHPHQRGHNPICTMESTKVPSEPWQASDNEQLRRMTNMNWPKTQRERVRNKISFLFYSSSMGLFSPAKRQIIKSDGTFSYCLPPCHFVSFMRHCAIVWRKVFESALRHILGSDVGTLGHVGNLSSGSSPVHTNIHLGPCDHNVQQLTGFMSMGPVFPKNWS